jgi:ABC-2 type transport system ATP-binding protein
MIFPRAGRPIVEQVSELVRIRGWSVDELFVERGRLDDVFRDITQRPN